MNIPNALTLLRILLTPAIVYLYVYRSVSWATAALVFAYFTDFLDGRIARKYNMITRLGQVLDPLADKLLAAAVLFCTVSSGRVPAWCAWIMGAQMAYLALGACFLLPKNIIIPANYWGKGATALFFLATLLLFPDYGAESVVAIGQIILYIALALMLCAAVSYTKAALSAWRARA
ncbi:MAG: CDP-alcohol phosphatidyltransferase family protein [Christensenellales bacterium]